MNMRIAVVLTCCGALVGVTAFDAAYAQDAFPSRVVQIVVPYTPGTTADILARLVAPKLAERWKVGVITDNRPGATGSIGIAAVAKGPPDGHSILFVPSSYTMMPALYRTLPYDPVKSLAPIGLIATGTLALVVHAQLPARSMRELVELAKRRPGELLYASPGNGSAQHLAMELLKLEKHTDLVHVPYKGLAPPMTELVGGHVQVMISSFQTVQPHVMSGRLRMLAVTGARRSPVLPAVPTISEQGWPQLEMDSWYGALAPTATPAPIVSRLNADLAWSLQQTDVRDQIEKQGMSPGMTSPDQFAAIIRQELGRWARVVANARIKLD